VSPRKRDPGGGPVTAERVVEAALRVIDLEGLDAHTMRRLAHDLGVEPVTVYRQLPNKEAILASVSERLWQQVRPTEEDLPEGAGWRARIRAMWLTLYALMLAHPNAIPLIAKGGSYSASAAGGTAAMAALLSEAGLSPDDAAEQIHILSACVVGFGFARLWAGELAGGGRPEQPAGEPPAPPPPELLPYLARLARWDAGEFGRALDIVLGANGAPGDSPAADG
jgi:TetR/AcrR family tetracycline transcriptional repressor